MNLVETEVERGEEIQIRLDPNVIVLKIQSTGKIATNLQGLSYYQAAANFIIQNQDNNYNKNKISISYYKWQAQDVQNIQKLYFFLIGIAQNLDLYNAEQQSLIVELIIYICMKQHKGQEAIDFVSKVPEEQKYISYLVLAIQFDGCLHARNACLCLLKSYQSFFTDENEHFAQQMQQLYLVPNNNDYFDMYVLVIKYKHRVLKMIQSLNLASVSQLFETQKNVAIIHLLYILAKYDFYNTYSSQDNICLDIIQNYMLNCIYTNNQEIQKEVQELYLLIHQQIQSLDLQQQIQLLYYILLKNCDQGIYSIILQDIMMIIHDNYQSNQYLYHNNIQQFDKQKMSYLVNSLKNKLTFYISNHQIQNGLAIATSIIQLISLLNYDLCDVLTTLIDNFWSKNEYELQDIKTKRIKKVKKFIKSFADDIILYQFIFSKFFECQKYSLALNEQTQSLNIRDNIAQDSTQQLNVIISELYTSLFYNFNVQVNVQLQFESTKMQEETGMNIGQIFYVANSIYEFCLLYCKDVAIWWLETHYFPSVIDFYKQYCGSDALINQVFCALHDYCELKGVRIQTGEQKDKEINIQTHSQINPNKISQIKWKQILLLFLNLYQWIEYQLSRAYFDVLANICRLFQYGVQENHLDVNILQGILPQCILFISQNQLASETCLKEIIALHLICSDGNISLFCEILKQIQTYPKYVDIQYIYLVLNIYLQSLNNYYSLQKIQSEDQQINIESNTIFDTFIQFLNSQTSKLFSERSYVWFARCIKTIQRYINPTNQQNSINVIQEQLSEIYKQAPPIFFEELNQEINNSQSLFDSTVSGNHKLQNTPEDKQINNSDGLNNCDNFSKTKQLPYNYNSYQYLNTYIQINDIDDFPTYTESDKIIQLVKCPGIHFTYLFPHPMAKNKSNRLKSLNIDGIQNIEDNNSEQTISNDNSQKKKPAQMSPTKYNQPYDAKPLYDDFDTSINPTLSEKLNLHGKGHTTEINVGALGAVKIIDMTKRSSNAKVESQLEPSQQTILKAKNLPKQTMLQLQNPTFINNLKKFRHWSAGGSWDQYDGESMIKNGQPCPDQNVRLYTDDAVHQKRQSWKRETKDEERQRNSDQKQSTIITSNEDLRESEETRDKIIEPPHKTPPCKAMFDDSWSEEDADEEDLMQAIGLDAAV